VIPHEEQIYKVYVIDEGFDYVIKPSIPEKVVHADDLFFF
jgi:hypothetical protein